METLLDRLAVPRDVRKTADPARAELTLHATLEAGDRAIVWADLALLPYSGIPRDDGWWAVTPIVVYGLDNGTVSSPIGRAGRCTSVGRISPPLGAASPRSATAR